MAKESSALLELKKLEEKYTKEREELLTKAKQAAETAVAELVEKLDALAVDFPKEVAKGVKHLHSGGAIIGNGKQTPGKRLGKAEKDDAARKLATVLDKKVGKKKADIAAALGIEAKSFPAVLKHAGTLGIKYKQEGNKASTVYLAA